MSSNEENPPRLATEDEFKSAIKNHPLAVVHFSADWMEQCIDINKYLHELMAQKKYAQVKFYQLAAEQLSNVSFEYDVKAVPTTIIFKNGNNVSRIKGMHPGKILEAITTHCSDTNAITDETPTKLNKSAIEERLKTLINQSKVMLFMKGDRQTPRCGFSKQIVQLLNETGATYETFDILTDDEVRQELKAFSDWPTYPQLYINGDLMGGLDIVTELKNSGQLQNTLKS